MHPNTCTNNYNLNILYTIKGAQSMGFELIWPNAKLRF